MKRALIIWLLALNTMTLAGCSMAPRDMAYDEYSQQAPTTVDRLGKWVYAQRGSYKVTRLEIEGGTILFSGELLLDGEMSDCEIGYIYQSGGLGEETVFHRSSPMLEMKMKPFDGTTLFKVKFELDEDVSAFRRAHSDDGSVIAFTDFGLAPIWLRRRDWSLHVSFLFRDIQQYIKVFRWPLVLVYDELYPPKSLASHRTFSKSSFNTTIRG